MLDDLILPLPVPFRSGTAVLRRAGVEDAVAIIALLADDPISASRGDTASAEDRDLYVAALKAVLANPSNDLLVAEIDGDVVATFQLTLIPGMSRRGALRMLIEAVRVRSDLRSAGLGSAMMRWVMEDAAPALGAAIVQLTSDAARMDAHRFYENLGFVGSHRGFKYSVPSSDRSPGPR